MRILQLREQQQIDLQEGLLTAEEIEALFRLDEQRRQVGAPPVFDWHYRYYLRTRNQVGVIQLPSRQLEILPWMETTPQPGEPRRIQRNLLVMLHLSDLLPFSWKHLADVARYPFSLMETFLFLFAEGLLQELQRGLPRDFIIREQRSTYIRGKLQLSRQLRESPGQYLPHHTAQTWMVEDTPLNRWLKAGVRLAHRLSTHEETRRRLRALLAMLHEVTDDPPHRLPPLHLPLDRRFQRFEPLVSFVRLLLQQTSPAFHAGETFTFSLLFPMEQVFERFVAALFHRHREDLTANRWQLHIQSRHPLLEAEDQTETPAAGVQPDIILTGNTGETLVLDTKWKHLPPRRPLLPEREDLYQMMAYTVALRPRRTVLIYPQHSNLRPHRYRLAAEPQVQLWLTFLPLDIDLMETFEPLLEVLRSCIHV